MCHSGNRPWSCECHRKFLCDKDWHALRVASLALLRPCQGELLVASSPSVAIRIVCDSARFLGVELPSPVVGHLHTIEVGQSRAVFGQRRVGFAERNEGQGQLGPTHCRQGADFSGRPHAWGPEALATRCASARRWRIPHRSFVAAIAPTNRRSSVPNAARWQACRSVASHHPQRPGSSRRSSACRSSDVYGAHCPCPRQVAGMAVHSTQVATTEFWGEGDSPLKSAAARVCKEARWRVTTNVRVQDLDLPPRAGADNRWLEVVADGLPSFHGAQFAIDITISSPVRMDGSPRRQCATTDGAAVAEARVRKERTYPELRFEVGHAWWW